MSEDHKWRLQQQLWNIAKTLRSKMDADEMRLLQKMFDECYGRVS